MGNSNVRYLNFDAEVKQAGQDVFIEGFANRFSMDGKLLVDRGNDLIPPDAFELEEFKTLPIIFFNHDRNQPVGKATQIQKKEDGLFIKVKMSNAEHPEVARVRTLVKEGILKAFSVGFDPIEIDQEEVEGEKVNVIKKANLLEVSIVSIPMAQHSLFNVTSKSLSEMPITTARKVLAHPEWFTEGKEKQTGIPSQPSEAELSNPMLDIMKQSNVFLASLIREIQLLGEKIETLRPEPEPEGEEVGTDEAQEIPEEPPETPGEEETEPEDEEEEETQENACDDCEGETREEDSEEEKTPKDGEEQEEEKQRKLELIDSYSDVCNKILKSIGY